jgi:plasmid stability protein
MASLLVRNIPESLKERLKRRAKKHGQSMEQEVRQILRTAAYEPEKPQYGLGTEIANLFRQLGTGEAPNIVEMRGFRAKPAKFDE